jgi:hypothetical protein
MAMTETARPRDHEELRRERLMLLALAIEDRRAFRGSHLIRLLQDPVDREPKFRALISASPKT